MLHRLAKLCSRRSIATGANWQPKAKDRLAFGMGGAAITVAILAQGLNEVMRSRNLRFSRAFATWNGCAKSNRHVAGVGGAAITVAILAQGSNEVMRSRNLSFLRRTAPRLKTFFNKTRKLKKPTAP
jgi:hypothetical protein